MARPRCPPAGPAAATPEPARPAQVLVVDDDLRNVFAITSVLELYGLTVVHAPSGQQGIETLRPDPDIDLVLMDVMMPEMDGYTTTAAIREMPEFADLPVIAVTARAMQGDRDKSLAAGATDYVTKPVDTEELLGCIKRWLPRRPGGRLSRPPGRPPGPGPGPAPGHRWPGAATGAGGSSRQLSPNSCHRYPAASASS